MSRSTPREILSIGPDGELVCSSLLRLKIKVCEQAIKDGKDTDICWAKRELGCILLFEIGREDKDYLKRRYPSFDRCEKKGYIYLIRNNRNGYIKIGWSKQPGKREKTLQSEDPDIEIIHLWRGSRSEECKLHVLYRVFRIRGEWFRLSESQISEIKTAHP